MRNPGLDEELTGTWLQRGKNKPVISKSRLVTAEP